MLKYVIFWEAVVAWDGCFGSFEQECCLAVDVLKSDVFISPYSFPPPLPTGPIQLLEEWAGFFSISVAWELSAES